MSGERIGYELTYALDVGRVIDFGHCYAQLVLTIDGRVGIKIVPDGEGVLTPHEARRLAQFLSGQSHAIELDAMRRKDSSGRTLPRGLVVYVISDGNGLFKIGKAVDVSARIKQLQTGNGRKLQLIAFFMCPDDQSAYRLESAAHEALASRRSVGEWFDCDHVDAVNAIYAAKASTGVEGSVRVLSHLAKEIRDAAQAN